VLTSWATDDCGGVRFYHANGDHHPACKHCRPFLVGALACSANRRKAFYGYPSDPRRPSWLVWPMVVSDTTLSCRSRGNHLGSLDGDAAATRFQTQNRYIRAQQWRVNMARGPISHKAGVPRHEKSVGATGRQPPAAGASK
jgi:hypothetical protein